MEKELKDLKAESIAVIRSKHIWKYRDYLLRQVKEEKLRAISASNNLNCVKKFFKFLKKRRDIVYDPCLEVDAIKVNREKIARKVSLPIDVVAKINKVDYTHLYRFPIKELINFLILTGARLGEALHSEPQDFDLEKAIWYIKEKPKCPTRFGLGWKPKNGNNRVVPLNAEALTIIKELIEKEKSRKTIGYIANRNKPIEAHFLFSMIDRKLSTRRKDMHKTRRPVTIWRRVDSIDKSWKNLFVKAGICVPDMNREGELLVEYTRHDARRSWNYEAEKLGLNLKERATLLGHEPRVNRSNYNGETYIDFDSVTDKISNMRIEPHDKKRKQKLQIA